MKRERVSLLDRDGKLGKEVGATHEGRGRYDSCCTDSWIISV
jgi:hypothetical protein